MPDPQPHPPADRDETRVFDPKPFDGSTRAVDPFDANGLTRSAAGGPPAEPAPPPDGVPGYTIVRELGRGGMGVVYLARQTGLNRDVALKMVLAGGHASAAERIRFLAEAESVAAVQHPGIVQVFDFGTHSGQPFFALEYLPGGSLADALQKTLPEPLVAARLIEKLSRAVHAAHIKGIIHRDLKPSNILLADDGSPKVTDFGLARKTDSGSGLTQTGAVIGTPSYMSPEQASGQHNKTGPETDVYAVGAILYECLTGRPPFRAATAVDTIMQVVSEEPVPPHRLVPKLPRDLETVCLKCLQKDPAKRYPSAEALADDVGRYLAGHPILARPVPVWEKGWRWAKRNPSYFVAAGFMFGSIVASIFLLASKNASLTLERNAARTAEAAAAAATIDAEENRKTAQARLERGVNAVEQMMLRVAGEKWALKPELQIERREVLEEAVGFFNSLGSDESKDPIVRKQSARANLFAATAYMQLSLYDKCLASCTVARDLYRELQSELPNDSTFLRGEAEACALLGHVDALNTRYVASLGHYEQVLKLAEKAVAIEPDSDENQVALADAYTSLALFYSIQRPELHREYLVKVMAIGEKLCAKPAPGFKARLVYATALINLGVSEYGTNAVAAVAKLTTARTQIDVLDKLTPPSARAAETFLVAKAGLTVYSGLFAVRRMQLDKGLSEMKEGISILNRMLTIQPKSFPLRFQHLQFQILYAEVLLNKGRLREAEQIFIEVDREQSALSRDQPQMTWLKGIGQVQRSNLLIQRVREDFSPNFEGTAKDLMEAVSGQASVYSIVLYNVACAYAQAALFGPVAERLRYADAAMANLNKLLNQHAYFKVAETVRHLDRDIDLDPLRSRPDFRTFLQAARDQAGIRESAPPPRKIELK